MKKIDVLTFSQLFKMKLPNTYFYNITVGGNILNKSKTQAKIIF